MIKRCIERAKTSGRLDDNEETIKKRINVYFEESESVIDYYDKIGKCCKIDATRSIEEVFEDT